MMRVDVGPTRERQMLTQMLDRGRTLNGQKMPEEALKAYGSDRRDRIRWRRFSARPTRCS